MKRYIRTTIILITSIAIALVSAAVTFTTRLAGNKYSTTAALVLQTTPTPQAGEDRSEIGSTDRIVTMGIFIAVIVLVPVLLQYKMWRRVE